MWRSLIAYLYYCLARTPTWRAGKNEHKEALEQGLTSSVLRGRSPKLELELIQTHMTQKPLLWVEVGAQKVRVCWGGEGRRECRECRVALVCVLSLKPFWAVWRRQLSLCGAPPQGVVCKAPLISEWVV
jgi:hypothetical protein